MTYAVGRKSLGICDRCGFEYRYLELQKEWNGLKVCPQCYEQKHPQLEPSPPPHEPEVLHEPRTDRTEPQTVFVGQTIFNISKPLQAIIQLGTVTVTIS
tara:strand:+ start:1085 stop:1381 length:297 start_codon:yes stop_codon:yes gene_type:complete